MMGNTQRHKKEYLTVQVGEEKTLRFERIQEFIYLGVKIKDDGHDEEEIY